MVLDTQLKIALQKHKDMTACYTRKVAKMAPFGAKFVPNFIPSDQGDQNGHSLDRGILHVEMLGKKCGNSFLTSF